MKLLLVYYWCIEYFFLQILNIFIVQMIWPTTSDTTTGWRMAVQVLLPSRPLWTTQSFGLDTESSWKITFPFRMPMWGMCISYSHMGMCSSAWWNPQWQRHNLFAWPLSTRLIIIDEVHLLNDERGAVIETVVARSLRFQESTWAMRLWPRTW